MKRIKYTLATALLALASFGSLLATGAQARPITIAFEASGFAQGGTPSPGVDDNLSGSVSWNADDPLDPIAALTDIDLTIDGHRYVLSEVGVIADVSTSMVIGGTARGVNAVVGDGAFHDFLVVIDRIAPEITAFAFSVQGRSNTIWWFPTQTSARYVSAPAVDAPPSAALAALALLALGGAAIRRRRQPPRLRIQSAVPKNA